MSLIKCLWREKSVDPEHQLKSLLEISTSQVCFILHYTGHKERLFLLRLEWSWLTSKAAVSRGLAFCSNHPSLDPVIFHEGRNHGREKAFLLQLPCISFLFDGKHRVVSFHVAPQLHELPVSPCLVSDLQVIRAVSTHEWLLFHLLKSIRHQGHPRNCLGMF